VTYAKARVTWQVQIPHTPPLHLWRPAGPPGWHPTVL